MALRLWLPLNGSLVNQGLDDYEITTLGTISWVNGKIGKALSAGTASRTPNGVSINSNLTDVLSNNYSVAVWVKPLGNHVHYNGTILSSGNWNNTRWAFGLSQDNTKVDVLSNGYNVYLDCPIPVNEWTHICCVRTSDELVSLYKNGEYVNSLHRDDHPSSDATNTTVGRETYASGYFSFNGNINDLRLYDHALSLKEIKELSKGLVLHYPLSDPYVEDTTNLITSLSSGGRTVVVNNTTIQTTGENADTYWYFNVPSSALVTGNTYTFSCYVSGLSNTSSDCKFGIGAQSALHAAHAGYLILTKNGFHSLTFTCPSGLNGSTKIICDDASGAWRSDIVSITNIQLEAKDHATGYTPFGTTRDENIVYDVSGYGNNGSVTGSLAYSSDTPRYLGSTYITNGSVGHIEGIPLPISSQTLCMWVKCDKTRDQCVFCDKNTQLEFSFLHNAIYIRTASQHGYSTTHWNDNEWNHIAVIKENNGVWNLYINGQLETNNASNNYYIHNADNFWIGNRSFNNSYPSLNCFISDVRIYTTALSADDVLTLYNTPTSIANNGTLLTQGEILEV